MFNDGDAGDDDDGNGSKPPDLTKKRKRFSSEEDMLLKALVDGKRQKSWDQIAREIPGRTARQCRDRYNNYLFKEISGASWKPTEDEIILKMHKEVGPKWSLIAKHLVGRSGNNVKNRWYKFLSKQKHLHSYQISETNSEPKVEIPKQTVEQSDSDPDDDPSLALFPPLDSSLQPFEVFTDERLYNIVDDWDV